MSCLKLSAGQVTGYNRKAAAKVHRYFPLPGHRNSGPAALLVEAAAHQGKYQQMYTKMFDTRPQWGEKQDSQATLFRTYARDLGLDMSWYDTSVAN